MYTTESQAEIQNPTQQNLIGRSNTSSPTVLSPNSILPPPSPYCDFFFPLEKFRRAVQKLCYFNFLTFFIKKKGCSNLHNSENVCTEYFAVQISEFYSSSNDSISSSNSSSSGL